MVGVSTTRMNIEEAAIMRDTRWEITADYDGCSGKLIVRHLQNGTHEEWPEDLAVTARAYELEYEVDIQTLRKAMNLAKGFIRRFGAGEVEWIAWDVDGQRHVVVKHVSRDRLGWEDTPDPLPVKVGKVT